MSDQVMTRTAALPRQTGADEDIAPLDGDAAEVPENQLGVAGLLDPHTIMVGGTDQRPQPHGDPLLQSSAEIVSGAAGERGQEKARHQDAEGSERHGAIRSTENAKTQKSEKAK